jgi:hypothetical protein
MLSAGMLAARADSIAALRRRLPLGNHRRLEAQVALGVSAAVPRRDRDLAQDLGEQLAALDVGLALLALDLRPP